MFLSASFCSNSLEIMAEVGENLGDQYMTVVFATPTRPGNVYQIMKIGLLNTKIRQSFIFNWNKLY